LELKDPSAEEDASTLKASRDSRENELVRLAMEKAEWNVSRAAAELEIGRPTLYQLLARYGLLLKKTNSEDQKEKA
jgi:transcriptional regulator of acetoin/glycerol metabolism